MEERDTGLLLHKQDIQLHRKWFKEMTKLIGIIVKYKHPLKDKHYDLHGELQEHYSTPCEVGVIFEEHPKQWTMKKLGWVSELDEGMSIIHVPYDLEELQVGSLFLIPPGVDGGEPRLFRVVKMSTGAVYPASVTCEIGPMFESVFERSQLQHVDNNFSLLADDEED